MIKKKNINLKDFALFALANVAIVALHYLHNPNDLAMRDLNPNPLLILSVIFSAYRGLKFSMYCSVFAASTYFLLFLYQVDFKAVEDIYSLEFVFLPMLIIATSTIIGDLQERTISRINIWKNKYEEKRYYDKKIEEKQELLEKEIYYLKKKIVTKVDTIKNLHESAIKLQSLNVEELINNLLHVISERVEVKKSFFYIYDTETNQFEFSAPSSASKEDVEAYDIGNDQVVSKSIELKRLVSIREFSKIEGKNGKLGLHSLISMPVYLDGELYGVYVILSMPFLEFVPMNLNVIKELGLWFEEALAKAIEFEASEVSLDKDIKYKAYKYKYFEKRLSEELILSKKYSIPLNVLKISFENFSMATEYKQRMLKKFVIEFLRLHLKTIDAVCLGKKDNEILIIFLEEREKVIVKAGLISEELSRFNLLVGSNDDEKLKTHYEITSSKNQTIKLDEILDSFERVA